MTVSHESVAENVCKIFKCHGVIVAVKDCISVLGVDYAAGKNISYTKMKERLLAARKKATKIMSLTKGGVESYQHDAFARCFLSRLLCQG